jgi:hypothetical protein
MRDTHESIVRNDDRNVRQAYASVSSRGVTVAIAQT